MCLKMQVQVNIVTVILAAGLGTRMRSRRAKVLHEVAGRPMIEYPVRIARALGSSRILCVLGHQAADVRAVLDERFGDGAVEAVLQQEQKGTGHAVLQTAPLLRGYTGSLLILYGDVPLLTEATLHRLVQAATTAPLALVSARPRDPTGYGRLIRDGAGAVVKVVEHKDASPTERAIGEVNAGIYCGAAPLFFEALGTVTATNAQAEIYLTDIVERAARSGRVATVEASAEEVMGINDRTGLACADRMMHRRVAESLMRSGVTIHAPEQSVIDVDVEVGRDSELGPGVQLRGKTRIGEGCRVDAGVVITDSKVGERVHIKPYCVITESQVGDGARVGPFAHLRPGSMLDAEVQLGNFVETKKAHLGKGAKANHLSYLGDAEIGAGVNIGCGTITCNYDGYAKYPTTIEEGAFIGSDSQLVAPVTVGRGAVIAAGTTVYEDVPAGALALTRPQQVVVPGYAERKRKRMEDGLAGGGAAPGRRASSLPARAKPAKTGKAGRRARRKTTRTGSRKRP